MMQLACSTGGYDHHILIGMEGALNWEGPNFVVGQNGVATQIFCLFFFTGGGTCRYDETWAFRDTQYSLNSL